MRLSASTVPAPIAKSLLSPRSTKLIRSTHSGFGFGGVPLGWNLSGSPRPGSALGAAERTQRTPSNSSRLVAFQ